MGVLFFFGLCLLGKVVKELPQEPNQEEIERVTATLPEDEKHKEQLKALLYDPYNREKLRAKLKEFAKVA